MQSAFLQVCKIHPLLLQIDNWKWERLQELYWESWTLMLTATVNFTKACVSAILAVSSMLSAGFLWRMIFCEMLDSCIFPIVRHLPLNKCSILLKGMWKCICIVVRTRKDYFDNICLYIQVCWHYKSSKRDSISWWTWRWIHSISVYVWSKFESDCEWGSWKVSCWRSVGRTKQDVKGFRETFNYTLV